MAFAPSGAQALEIMAQESFDIIVSDMRMPGMDGARLLAEVRDKYPNTIRFVLSGQSDRETIFRSVGAAHQFMSKPCNPKDLEMTVDRAFALREVLRNSKVMETVSRIGDLPALPQTYSRLIELLQSSDCSIGEVGRIIESDLAMTAKILQLVNSAFFGVRRQVTTATQAAGLLGLDIIRSLVLTSGVFQSAANRKMPARFSMDALWEHSMMVGGVAQTIAKQAGMGEGIRSESLTAGLLHDAGKLLLAAGFIKEYGEVVRIVLAEKKPFAAVEREFFGCSHAEVGAYLLGIWGLPDPIVEAVAFHHRTTDSLPESFTPLIAVSLANVFSYENEDYSNEEFSRLKSTTYLKSLPDTQLSEWHNACLALKQEKERETHE